MSRTPFVRATGKKKGDDNAWLETYADSITLLMAFFVILLSMSSMDKKKYDYVKAAIESELNTTVVEEFNSPNSQAGEVNQIRNYETPKMPTLDKMSFLNTISELQVNYKDDGAEMVFEEGVLFVPNSHKLRGDVMPVLNSTSRYLKQLKKETHKIIVEGYTDGVMPTPRKYGNRWNFSSARAITIREFLEESGVEQEMISIAAFADTRPVVPDLTASGEPIHENLIQNRRLIIRVLPVVN